MTDAIKPKRIHTPKNFVFYLTVGTDDPIHMEWRGLPQAVAMKMHNLTQKKMRIEPDMRIRYGWEESK